MKNLPLKKEDVYPNPDSKLIGKIEIKLEGLCEHLPEYEMEEWEDSRSSINIKYSWEQIGCLLDADEIVIEDREAKIVINYPLNKPTMFLVKSDHEDGFTKKDFITKVSDIYYEIYAGVEEIEIMENLPMEQESKASIENSNKKYGLWGWTFHEVDLVGAEIRQNPNGEHLIYLDVCFGWDLRKNPMIYNSNEFTSPGILIGLPKFRLQGIASDYSGYPEKGVVPFINMKCAQSEIPYLIGADEIVLKEHFATLEIYYPNTGTVVLFFQSDDPRGFTRKELALKVSEIYYNRYIKEEKTKRDDSNEWLLVAIEIRRKPGGEICLFPKVKPRDFLKSHS